MSAAVMVMLLTSILVTLVARLSRTAVAHAAVCMLLLVVPAVLSVAASVPDASAV
jgi:hypothetical protein